MSTTVVSGDGNNHSHPSTDPLHILAPPILLLALSFSLSLLSILTRWFFSPFLFLYPFLSHLVSPLLHFLAAIANVFFLTPLSTTRYILSSVYPIYAFCGVACITGIVVGIGGRGLSALLTGAFAKPEKHPSRVPTISENRSRRRRARLSAEQQVYT